MTKKPTALLLKIGAVMPTADGGAIVEGTGLLDGMGARFDAEWVAKYQPEVGGYLVIDDTDGISAVARGAAAP